MPLAGQVGLSHVVDEPLEDRAGDRSARHRVVRRDAGQADRRHRLGEGVEDGVDGRTGGWCPMRFGDDVRGVAEAVVSRSRECGTTAPASTTCAASSASVPNQRAESLTTGMARSQSRPATASSRTDTGRSRSPEGATTSSEEESVAGRRADPSACGNPPESQNGGIVCVPSHPQMCTAPRRQEATTWTDGGIASTLTIPCQVRDRSVWSRSGKSNPGPFHLRVTAGLGGVAPQDPHHARRSTPPPPAGCSPHSATNATGRCSPSACAPGCAQARPPACGGTTSTATLHVQRGRQAVGDESRCRQSQDRGVTPVDRAAAGRDGRLARRASPPYARRPWRSSVACVFDADCGGDPALVDEKPPSVELSRMRAHAPLTITISLPSESATRQRSSDSSRSRPPAATVVARRACARSDGTASSKWMRLRCPRRSVSRASSSGTPAPGSAAADRGCR